MIMATPIMADAGSGSKLVLPGLPVGVGLYRTERPPIGVPLAGMPHAAFLLVLMLALA